MAYIKGINIVIGADTTQLDSALNRIDRNSRALNKELRQVNNSLQFDPKNTDLLAQKQKILIERYSETKSRLDALKQAQEGVNKAYENGEISKTDYRQFQTDLATTESKLKGYGEQLKKVSEEYEHLSSKLGQASDKLKSFGDKSVDISKKLAPASIAAAGVLGVVTKQAIDFESAFAGVEKTVDGTSEQMASLKQGIRDMAKEIPASTTEISAVAEAAGQLGIQTDSVLDFTRVMIDMGNSTNLSSDVAATTLARFANVTKMSQKDFSKLGSVIVALGNNFATTESEIASMAMNLGSAGAQVGMSQANIVALATALSSVGLEAQAGGTAFSKVMIEMQLAAETGSAELKEFASVAGMSADQFAKAFKTDATGAILSFIDGLSKTGEQGQSAIKVLDDMGITETRLRDSLLRSANASNILTNAVALSNRAWDENVALSNEANQRYGTTESRLQVMKNKFNDIAISLGEKVLPHINKFLEWLSGLIDKFDNLSPGMQVFIVKALAITAATAPVVGVVGKLSSGLGSLLGAAGKGARALGLLKPAANVASTALTSTGVATTAASSGILASVGGLGGLASSLGAAAAAAAPFVLAAGAIAGAGYLVYKSMESDAVPAVDLFADHVKHTSAYVAETYSGMTQVIQTETVKISEDAQNRIQTYLDMSNAVQQESMNMYLGLTEITDTNVASLQEKNQALADSIVENVNRQKEESINAYQEMFNNTTVTTAEQEAEILKLVEQGSANRIKDVETLKNELNKLFEEIKNQGTDVTKTQQEQIDSLYDQMKEHAIKSMADTEAEQGVILNRLSSSNTRATAEMVGDAVKEYNRLYDEAVDKAGAQRDAVVKQAELMKSELGGEYGKMADDIIADANRQYEAVVEAQKKTRSEGLTKLEAAYKELANVVDYNTGDILKGWDKVKNSWTGWKPEDKRAVVITEYRSVYTEVDNRSGSSYRPGYNDGLAYVPYNNFVARLHKGERVLTAEENKQLDTLGFLGDMKNGLSNLASQITNKIDNSTVNNSFVMAGTYHIREEADIQQIIKGLSNEINRKRRG